MSWGSMASSPFPPADCSSEGVRPPWTNEILHALGARDIIATSGFVEKWGASFRPPDGAAEQYADFQTALETPRPQTFQVLREKFDEILLRHSEKCGARVLEEHRLLDAAFDPQAVHRRQSRPTPEESLAHYLADTPAAAPLLERAQRVSPARFDADYSYLATRMAGDRWVAVGDAAAFLDPIFSTGVMLAMQGGLEAAEAIDAGLRAGDVSARAFARYERGVRRRYHHFRRFAVGFYDPAFRELWYSRPPFTSIFNAVVSVLAGNWRPSVATRVLVEMFFAVVAVKRVLRTFGRTRRVR